jgi:hypothetical protein
MGLDQQELTNPTQNCSNFCDIDCDILHSVSLLRGAIQIGIDSERKDEITLNIYLSGCNPNKNCDRNKCHNKWLQSFSNGELITKQLQTMIDTLNSGIIDSIVLLGGEPFDQKMESLSGLLSIIRAHTSCPIYAYSGYTFDIVYNKAKKLNLTGICCNPYKEGVDKEWYYLL